MRHQRTCSHGGQYWSSLLLFRWYVKSDAKVSYVVTTIEFLARTRGFRLRPGPWYEYTRPGSFSFDFASSIHCPTRDTLHWTRRAAGLVRAKNEHSTCRTQRGLLTTTSVPREMILPRLGSAVECRSKSTGSRNATEVSGEGGIASDRLPGSGSSGAGFAKMVAREITVFPTVHENVDGAA